MVLHVFRVLRADSVWVAEDNGIEHEKERFPEALPTFASLLLEACSADSQLQAQGQSELFAALPGNSAPSSLAHKTTPTCNNKHLEPGPRRTLDSPIDVVPESPSDAHPSQLASPVDQREAEWSSAALQPVATCAERGAAQHESPRTESADCEHLSGPMKPAVGQQAEVATGHLLDFDIVIEAPAALQPQEEGLGGKPDFDYSSTQMTAPPMKRGWGGQRVRPNQLATINTAAGPVDMGQQAGQQLVQPVPHLQPGSAHLTDPMQQQPVPHLHQGQGMPACETAHLPLLVAAEAAPAQSTHAVEQELAHKHSVQSDSMGHQNVQKQQLLQQQQHGHTEGALQAQTPGPTASLLLPAKGMQTEAEQLPPDPPAFFAPVSDTMQARGGSPGHAPAQLPKKRGLQVPVPDGKTFKLPRVSKKGLGVKGVSTDLEQYNHLQTQRAQQAAQQRGDAAALEAKKLRVAAIQAAMLADASAAEGNLPPLPSEQHGAWTFQQPKSLEFVPYPQHAQHPEQGDQLRHPQQPPSTCKSHPPHIPLPGTHPSFGLQQPLQQPGASGRSQLLATATAAPPLGLQCSGRPPLVPLKSNFSFPWQQPLRPVVGPQAPGLAVAGSTGDPSAPRNAIDPCAPTTASGCPPDQGLPAALAAAPAGAIVAASGRAFGGSVSVAGLQRAAALFADIDGGQGSALGRRGPARAGRRQGQQLPQQRQRLQTAQQGVGSAAQQHLPTGHHQQSSGRSGPSPAPGSTPPCQGGPAPEGPPGGSMGRVQEGPRLAAGNAFGEAAGGAGFPSGIITSDTSLAGAAAKGVEQAAVRLQPARDVGVSVQSGVTVAGSREAVRALRAIPSPLSQVDGFPATLGSDDYILAAVEAEAAWKAQQPQHMSGTSGGGSQFAGCGTTGEQPHGVVRQGGSMLESEPGTNAGSLPFTTGGSKPLQGPLEKQLQAAQALFRDLDAGCAMDPGKQAGAAALPAQEKPVLESSSLGVQFRFVTGSGKAVAGPPAAKLKAAMALFGDVDLDPDSQCGEEEKPLAAASSKQLQEARALPGNSSKGGGESGDQALCTTEGAAVGGGSSAFPFMTGGGKAVAAPSSTKLQAAQALFGDIDGVSVVENEALQPSAQGGLGAGSGSSAFTVVTGGGRALAAPSASKLQAASALFGEGGGSPEGDDRRPTNACNAAAECPGGEFTPLAGRHKEMRPGRRVVAISACRVLGDEETPAPDTTPAGEPPHTAGMVASPFTTGHLKGRVLVAEDKLQAVTTFFGDQQEAHPQGGAVVPAQGADPAQEAGGTPMLRRQLLRTLPDSPCPLPKSPSLLGGEGRAAGRGPSRLGRGPARGGRASAAAVSRKGRRQFVTPVASKRFKPPTRLESASTPGATGPPSRLSTPATHKPSVQLHPLRGTLLKRLLSPSPPSPVQPVEGIEAGQRRGAEGGASAAGRGEGDKPEAARCGGEEGRVPAGEAVGRQLVDGRQEGPQGHLVQQGGGLAEEGSDACAADKAGAGGATGEAGAAPAEHGSRQQQQQERGAATEDAGPPSDQDRPGQEQPQPPLESEGPRGGAPSSIHRESTPPPPGHPPHTHCPPACIVPSSGEVGAIAPPSLPLDSRAAASYQLPAPQPSIDGGPSVGQLACWEGPLQLREALVALGASPDYASEAWVRNHYRWVVWKLARLELLLLVGQQGELRGRLLTKSVVMDELTARYEQEFNRGHAPLLKRVLQHDDSPGGLMVLMVAAVHPVRPGGNTPGQKAAAKLDLTDGWYWVTAVCDDPLTQLVAARRIMQGDKLRICGAELQSQGPAEPLEAARQSFLRLTANGVHKVHTSTKLGRQPHRTSILHLAGVYPQGGVIPRTLLVVHRVYPRMMWVKLPSGIDMYQTERQFQRVQRQADGDVDKAEGAVQADIQQQEVEECRQWLATARRQLKKLTNIERLYAKTVTEPGMERELGASEQEALQRFQECRVAELESRRQQLLQQRLHGMSAVPEAAIPTMFLLVGAVGHRQLPGRREAAPAQALVTIRRPSEDLEALLREGQVYSVTGLEPDVYGMRVRGLQGGSPLLKLKASKHTQWQLLDSCAARRDSLVWRDLPRRHPDLRGLAQIPWQSDFDFTGVVLKAGPPYKEAPGCVDVCQWIFLADSSIRSTDSHVPPPGQSAKQQQQLQPEHGGNQAAVQAALVASSRGGGEGEELGGTEGLAGGTNDSGTAGQQPGEERAAQSGLQQQAEQQAGVHPQAEGDVRTGSAPKLQGNGGREGGQRVVAQGQGGEAMAGSDGEQACEGEAQGKGEGVEAGGGSQGLEQRVEYSAREGVPSHTEGAPPHTGTPGPACSDAPPALAAALADGTISLAGSKDAGGVGASLEARGGGGSGAAGAAERGGGGVGHGGACLAGGGGEGAPSAAPPPVECAGGIAGGRHGGAAPVAGGSGAARVRGGKPLPPPPEHGTGGELPAAAGDTLILGGDSSEPSLPQTSRSRAQQPAALQQQQQQPPTARSAPGPGAVLGAEGGYPEMAGGRDLDAQPPWLLAVKLVAPPEAINWLEGGDEGCVVTLRDLTLRRADQRERLWNAEGSCRTGIHRVRAASGGQGGLSRSATEANLSWAAANHDVIHALQRRLTAVLGW